MIPLLALAAFAVLSIAGLQLSAAAALLLVLVRHRAELTFEGRTEQAALLLAATTLASLLASPALGLRFDWMHAWPFAALPLLLAAAQVGGERRFAWLPAVWVGSAVVASVVALIHVGSGGFDLLHALHLRREPIRIDAPGWPGHLAALGLFNSRLTFSHALLPPLGIALAGLSLRRGLRRALSGLAAALMLVALGLTFARAAWWGLGPIALAAVWPHLSSRRARIAVVGLGFAGAALLLAIPPIRARLLSSLSRGANDDRAFLWARGREVLHDFPASGVGHGAYPLVAAPHYDRVDPAFPMRTWAHQTPLTLAAETGLPGLLAWLLLWLAVASEALPALRAGRPEALGLAGGLAGLHVASLFHDQIHDGEVVWALVLGAVWLVAAGRQQAGQSPASSERSAVS